MTHYDVIISEIIQWHGNVFLATDYRDAQHDQLRMTPAHHQYMIEASQPAIRK